MSDAPSGLWVVDGDISRETLEYARPILQRAAASGATTATISGFHWTFTPLAVHPYTCGTCPWEGQTRRDYFDHIVREHHDHWEAVLDAVPV